MGLFGCSDPTGDDGELTCAICGVDVWSCACPVGFATEAVAEVIGRAFEDTRGVAEAERAGERIDGDTMEFRMKGDE